MNAENRSLRVGVYVDAANIGRNSGYGMHYGILREFACRGDAVAIRLNAYVGYDPERAREDAAYREGQRGFHDILREQGFKVIVKNVKWYADDQGGRIGKANADMDMAVDALLQSQSMDRVLLATGDGDFIQVAHALQNRGCRVEVIAFDNVSSELRREADMFVSGYLIPGLLPVSERDAAWGEADSRVRGTCYYYNRDKGFGFLRFLSSLSGNLWDVDPRKPNSPFKSAFFHMSELPEGFPVQEFPSRDLVMEFNLKWVVRGQGGEGQGEFQAVKIASVKGLG